MRYTRRLLLISLAALLAACGSFPENPALERFDPGAG